MNDDRLASLLLRWEMLAEQGAPPTAEELCRDCPELAEPLQRRIEALQEMAWLGKARGPAAERAAPALGIGPGSEPAPGYRVVRRLGRGGFGEVFEAVGPDGVSVALKVVPWSEQAEVEKRALVQLQGIRHPHLLATLGWWAGDAGLVLALELAEGTLLDRWREAQAAEGPGIPAEELLGYMRQAAEALDYLHARGVQHRDVKPQNLLLIGGAVKVGDFGLARLLEHSITGHTGRLTMAYAPPEYFDGRTTRQSDQYSLAATYCQVRGGRLPFAGTPGQMVAGHLTGQPDLAMLPAEERPAVARALAKQPRARWPDCRSFVAALTDPAAGGEMVPLGPRPGRAKAVSRRVAVAGLGGLLLTGLAAAVLRRPLEGSDRRIEGGHLDQMEGDPGELGILRSLSISPPTGALGGPLALTHGGRTVVWDLRTGKIVRQFEGCTGPAGAFLGPFLGRTLAAMGGNTGDVRVINVDTGAVEGEFPIHEGSVEGITCLPPARSLLTCGSDKTIRLWDRRTGQQERCLRGHLALVKAAVYVLNSQVLSVSWDGTVKLWSLDQGRLLDTLDLRTRDRPTSLVLTGRPDEALVGVTDGTVRVVRLVRDRLHEAGRVTGDPQSAVWHAEDVPGRGKPPWVMTAEEDVLRARDRATGREVYRGPMLPGRITAFAVVGIPPAPGPSHVVIACEEAGMWLLRPPAGVLPPA